LRKEPLVERRKQLAKLLKKAPDNIRFSAELQGDKEKLLAVARQFELEGLIAKKPESVYENGRRSGAATTSLALRSFRDRNGLADRLLETCPFRCDPPHK